MNERAHPNHLVSMSDFLYFQDKIIKEVFTDPELEKQYREHISKESIWPFMPRPNDHVVSETAYFPTITGPKKLILRWRIDLPNKADWLGLVEVTNRQGSWGLRSKSDDGRVFVMYEFPRNKLTCAHYVAASYPGFSQQYFFDTKQKAIDGWLGWHKNLAKMLVEWYSERNRHDEIPPHILVEYPELVPAMEEVTP